MYTVYKTQHIKINELEIYGSSDIRFERVLEQIGYNHIMRYKRASELNFEACSTISIFEHIRIYTNILYRIKE